MRAFLLLCAALLLLGAGCATVRPEEKEFLADPGMSFTSGGMASRHEQHVLDNREGSSGAGTARGGGCGCN
jgi:Domain of unknown function (DUF4266)